MAVLPHAGFADQNRVVLGRTRQNLDHAADLVVAADDRIDFAICEHLPRVAPVAGQRLVGRLRFSGRNALVTAHRGQRFEEPGASNVERREQLCRRFRRCPRR